MTDQNIEDVEGLGESEAEVETPVESEMSSGEREVIEREARDLGWRPKDDWRGDTTNWADAPDFMERARRSPFYHKLQDMAAERDKALEADAARAAEFDARLKRMEAMSKDREERIRAQAQENLKAISERMRAAAETADMDQYRQLEADRERVEKMAAPVTDPKPPEQAPGEHPAVAKFRIENPWYGQDFRKSKAAFDAAEQAARMGFPVEAQMTAAAEAAAEYDEARKPKRPERTTPKAAAVDEGGLASRINGGGVKRLPPEALRQAKEDVAAGLYKDVDAWSKVYFANGGDAA